MKLPATRRELLNSGYVEREARPCKRCNRIIEFWLTPAGRLAPLEVMPAENWILRSHFETCPNAAEFRKEKPAEPDKPKQGELW